MTSYNAADLLGQLRNSGLVTGSGPTDFIINRPQEKELPLYLKVLLGVGAFIASMCFIGFLRAADIIHFDHEEGLIIWGLAFVAAAIGLQYIAGPHNTAKGSFMVQSSFAFIVIGKILFVLGMNKAIDYEGWGATLGLLIITCMTYHIYRPSIDHFLSSFFLLYSILANILNNTNQYNSDLMELSFNAFFLLQLAFAAVLFTHGKVKRDYIPLSYAFVFSLCGSILFLIPNAVDETSGPINPVFINMIVTVGSIALFGWAAGGIEKLKSEPLLLASIGAVLLGLISAPGVLLSIGLMVLGYTKHEKILSIAGILFMPSYLFLYYYSIDSSLMQKSGILIASGMALLAGRFYLRHKGWDKRGTSCA